MNDQTPTQINTLKFLEDIILDDQRAITNDSLKPHYEAMTNTFGKLRQAIDHRDHAASEMDRLAKELAGWTRFHEYQDRRVPGLQRRYETARDYVRATEDEQAGLL